MKSERGKPGTIELLARWAARGLTWGMAGALLWYSVNSLIVHSNDRDYCCDFDQILILLCVAGSLISYFFELVAGLASLWLAGMWIFNTTPVLPDLGPLNCLPLLLGALYATAWWLGRRRVKGQRDRDASNVQGGTSDEDGESEEGARDKA